MVIFDSKFLKITYNEKANAILEEWKMYYGPKVEMDAFRQPMLELIKTFKDKKLVKWLSDNTEQKRLNEKDQWWVEENFYPEIVKAGLTHVALVNAKSILGTGVAKNCLRNLSQEVEIEIFNNSEDGIDWLQKA